MKKCLLLIMIITTGLTFGQYTTPGTGVTWNLDSLVIYSGGVITGTFPSYILNDNIIISQNDEVDIEAGSFINCIQAASGFEVNGLLNASGTETDSITFSSDLQDSTGAYEGILFNSSSGSTGIIQYVQIEYASYGVRCIDASPTIMNSRFFKCDRGIQLSGSDALIKNNRIERSYEYGVLINLGSNPLIESNIIAHNNTQATSAKNQVSIGLQGNNSPVIRNNEIYAGSGQVTGGISLWVSGSTSYSDMLCEGNVIHGNSFGITLYSSSNGIINAVLRNNDIYNNTTNPNTLVSGSGINVNGSPFNTPVITQNSIYGNWWGITIQNGTIVQAGPNPNIGNIENTDSTDNGLNIIYNNIQGSDVFDLYNNCTNDVMAQNNDWGVYDSTSIEDHVFHKIDDPAHGLVIFMPFSPALPVELTKFTAGLNENLVELKWETGTETNNKGFVLERKYGTENKWLVIGFVNGQGNSTSPGQYSYTDQLSEPGEYYYRLKQIDFDGSANLSEILTVLYNPSFNFVLDQNYPNPFNPSTYINYHTSEAGHVRISVYNTLGQKISELVNGFQPAGNYKVRFDGINLVSGVYLYKLEINGKAAVRKMILLR